jgi:putative aldouronate transport system substrate-binding protein
MPYARDALGSGLFWDVEEHLADFEHLAAIDPKVVDGGRLGGVLYGVPHEGILARYGVLVRKDWLDRLGLEVPHTIDELAVVAEAFTTGDPTGTGQQTVGILDRAESFLWGFPEFAGYFGAGAFFELSPEGTVIPSFTTDASKEAMEWYRDAYSKGWINQEFVTMQKTNQEQAIAQDKGGIVFTALFAAQTFANIADSINPDSEVEWALVNDMTYGDVPRRIVSDTGGGMGGLMSFSTEALPTVEDLRRGLGLIDSLLAPEALDLMTNGIEGTHYEKDSDGAVTITDQPLWEKEVQPYAGIRPSSSTWYPSTNAYSNLANEMMEENAQHAVVNIAQSLDSPTYDSRWATIEKAVQDGWNKYVTGALDMAGFEAVIDDQRKQGLDDVIAEYTESYEQTVG